MVCLCVFLLNRQLPVPTLSNCIHISFGHLYLMVRNIFKLLNSEPQKRIVLLMLLLLLLLLLWNFPGPHFPRCQMNQIDKPVSVVPITLGSTPHKTHIKHQKTPKNAVFWTFFYFDSNIYNCVRFDFPRCQINLYKMASI